MGILVFYETKEEKTYKKVILLHLLFGGIPVPFLKSYCSSTNGHVYKIFTVSVFLLYILQHNRRLVIQGTEDGGDLEQESPASSGTKSKQARGPASRFPRGPCKQPPALH